MPEEEGSLLLKRVADPGMGGVLNSDIALPQSECDCTVRNTGFSPALGIEMYKVVFTSQK